MRPIRPDIRVISLISAIAFLVLFTVWLLACGSEWELLLRAITKSGIILTLLGLFWGFYIKVGWRWKPLRLWGWLSNVPDLAGRWEGTVCRHKNDTPHSFVIEISQTFNSISYRSFSSHSRGESITASIFSDETGQVFQIVSTWRCTTRKREDPTSEDTFHGTSIWNISFESGKKVIEDSYFTGREPQTKGVLYLEWKSRQLRNRFA